MELENIRDPSKHEGTPTEKPKDDTNRKLAKKRKKRKRAERYVKHLRHKSKRLKRKNAKLKEKLKQTQCELAKQESYSVEEQHDSDGYINLYFAEGKGDNLW